jgi:hypothetical protein
MHTLNSLLPSPLKVLVRRLRRKGGRFNSATTVKEALALQQWADRQGVSVYLFD